jgi:hypothetical protein
MMVLDSADSRIGATIIEMLNGVEIDREDRAGVGLDPMPI